jgi:pimeloyl-ACP methyl ester carboxylesterase
MNAYSQFDHPDILSFLFHPRKECGSFQGGNAVHDILIQVEAGISIGARIFMADKDSPALLFFHGNGEIVEDYNDLGPLFVRIGITFIPVDYRGYGRSGGIPTVSAMMADSHVIFSYIRSWLRDNGCAGPFIVMGRSLGSAPALELVSRHAGDIDGLIIESGFARALPLLRRLGLNPDRYGLSEDGGFGNERKIMMYHGPTLIIHAEHDHIIPHDDGVSLRNASNGNYLKMLTIPRADHNTIFMHGMREYLAAVKDLASEAGK